jgi:MbtH protein
MSRYKVVINHEEQYSIWPADRENALGWNDVGRVGSKDDCIDHIEQVWTNLSPAELRRKITALRNM